MEASHLEAHLKQQTEPEPEDPNHRKRITKKERRAAREAQRDLEAGQRADREAANGGKGRLIHGPLWNLEDKRNAIRNFSPSLFLLSTCTGLIGLLFYSNPYFAKAWSLPLGWGFWWLSVVEFIALGIVTFLRCYFFFDTVAALRKNRSFDLFFSVYILISFGILVEGVIRYCPKYFGDGFFTVSVVLWWITAVLSHLASVVVPFFLAFYHSRKMQDLNTLWLLAMFPGIVIGLSGPVIAGTIKDLAQARHIIYMTYLLLGAGIPLVFMTLTIILSRFYFVGLPPLAFVMSVFLPAAPMSLMGLTVLLLAKVSPLVFLPELAHASNLNFADSGLLSTMTVLGVFFFGTSMWWLCFAILTVGVVAWKHRGVPFTTAWWGCVFPVGLTGLLAVNLGKELQIDAFNIVGTGLSLFTVILGLYCTVRTTQLVWSGVVFARGI